MDEKQKQRVREFFTMKKRAYNMTFNTGNIFSRTVLKDLSKFCRADKTTFHEDARAHAVMEGRREVWLRIQNYLQLTPDELWDLYRKE